LSGFPPLLPPCVHVREWRDEDGVVTHVRGYAPHVDAQAHTCEHLMCGALLFRALCGRIDWAVARALR